MLYTKAFVEMYFEKLETRKPRLNVYVAAIEGTLGRRVLVEVTYA